MPVVVPGAFDAWMQLLSDHGTLEPRQVLEYAIGYARDGFAIAPTCADANPCTTDSCDTVAGCQHANVIDGTVCSDGLCVARPAPAPAVEPEPEPDPKARRRRGRRGS